MRTLRPIMLAAAAVLTFVLNASSATVLYNSEAGFTANLAPGSYLENFNAYTFGSFSGPTLPLSGGSGFAYTIGTTPGLSGLYSGNGNMSTDNAGDAMRVTFTGNPVLAVGGFFWASDISGEYRAGSVMITLNDGSTHSYSPLNTSTFAGFTSDIPITSITVEAPDIGGPIWPTMDHFYAGTVVPEPSALALSGLALAALTILRRRKA